MSNKQENNLKIIRNYNIFTVFNIATIILIKDQFLCWQIFSIPLNKMIKSLLNNLKLNKILQSTQRTDQSKVLLKNNKVDFHPFKKLI